MAIRRFSPKSMQALLCVACVLGVAAALSVDVTTDSGPIRGAATALGLAWQGALID